MIKQIVFTEEEYEEIKRKLKNQSKELKKLEDEIEDFKRRGGIGEIEGNGL